MPIDSRSFLSDRAKVTLPDGIRGLFPLEKPGVVSFLAGKPNPASFPFASLTLHLKPPLAVDVPLGIDLNGNADVGKDPENEKGVIVREEDGGVDLVLEGTDMHEALQYGPTAGLPRLVNWLTEFTSIVHDRPIPLASSSTFPTTTQPANGTSTPTTAAKKARRESFARMDHELDITATGEVTGDVVNGTGGAIQEESAGDEKEGDQVEEIPWRLSVGGGCQDLLNKAFQSILNPGDAVLVETPVYPGVLVQFKLLNLQMIEIEVDSLGLSSTNLRAALESWPADQLDKRPKVLYTTPHGSNPSGSSCPTERKMEVLEVCREFGVLIVEDDPYYFLAPSPYPSYFSLETKVIPDGGQVLRFDSFSKVLSSGMRLGFAVGPTPIMQAMDSNTSAANLQANGVAQGIAYRLLRYWGVQGFVEHGRRVALFYAKRRVAFEAIARKHLTPLGANWVSPEAGMFLWMDLSGAGIEDTHDLVMKEGYGRGVLAVPGGAFYCHERKAHHLRLSFSIVDMEAAEVGMARLAEAIREVQAKLKARQEEVTKAIKHGVEDLDAEFRPL